MVLFVIPIQSKNYLFNKPFTEIMILSLNINVKWISLLIMGKKDAKSKIMTDNYFRQECRWQKIVDQV